MKYFDALLQDGTTEEYIAYLPEAFPLSDIKTERLNMKKGKKDKIYFKDFATFDIETTTYLDDNYTPPRPKGFMYHWQMCIGGICCYGRVWEEWVSFMDMLQHLCLKHSAILVIYVHNLGFEFQFIRQCLLQWGTVEVFAPQTRKPLTVRVGDVFEFRCSWKLSNMSLHMFTKNEYGCKYLKADGDLDYNIYRTPNTELTRKEFSYCMGDVLALYSAVKHKMINEGDDITTIPLTSTSYVRRECRNACRADNTYYRQFLKQTMSKNIYILLKEASRGGDTGANRYLAGNIISNVDSYDVCSSYPYQMLTQLYPCSRFYPYGDNFTMDDFNELCKEKAVIFRIAIKGLRIKKEAIDAYLPYSKALEKPYNAKIANGRLLEAEACIYTFTEIDWLIFKQTYDYKEISISSVYTAKKALLPKPIRDVIIEYFKRKCELDILCQSYELTGQTQELINAKYLYMRSKNRLNGIFGMCYTDPVRDEILINLDTGEWSIQEPDIQKSLEDFYNNRNSFLVYAWGVWTTAYARLHLNNLINIIGDKTIYWDTDSDKGIVDKEAKWKIMLANREIKLKCIQTGAWCKVKGQIYYLGIYEHDGEYQEFITLGAKKYAYTDKKGELHVTISGVNKSKSPIHPDGARELKNINNFKPGFVFKEAGGTTLFYNDDDTWGYHTINGVKMLTGSNIGVVNSEYTLGITKEYAEIIGYNDYYIDKI